MNSFQLVTTSFKLEMQTMSYSILNLVEEVAEHGDDVDEDDAESQDDGGEVAEDGLRGDHVEAVLHCRERHQAAAVSHCAADGVYDGGLHFNGRYVHLQIARGTKPEKINLREDHLLGGADLTNQKEDNNINCLTVDLRRATPQVKTCLNSLT